MTATAAERLAALRDADLRALHADGKAPSLEELAGVIDGAVLSGRLSLPLVRSLGLWRGKVFEQQQSGEVVGHNRLGVGPVEVRRFRFTARVDRSLFTDRDVVLLDHDNPANPASVRRFHDELVEIEDGLYLATSHHGTGDDLRFLCHFALAKPATD